MQIKTITCHEVYNYGAILQEYALVQFLNSNGHTAETIHYKPWYLRTDFSLFQVSPKFDKPFVKQLYVAAKISLRLTNLKRKEAFDLFAQKYIPTGSVIYKSNEELEENLPEADAYICGSDQIWNSLFENGKDPAFYLNFVPSHKVKFSYAASFATDFIAEELKPLVKNYLRTFTAIGVRETSGVQLLNSLGINNAVQVLDPVFLLPQSHWETFVKDISGKFIFVYDFDCNPLVKKIAMHLKKEKGCAIYTVNQNINYADKNFYVNGPEYFLSLVKNAETVITNSFHALAFSLLFKKDFIVLNRTIEINTRMRDLLQQLQLSRLVETYEDFLKLKPINYDDVNTLIEEEILISKQFLLNSLNKT